LSPAGPLRGRRFRPETFVGNDSRIGERRPDDGGALPSGPASTQ